MGSFFLLCPYQILSKEFNDNLTLIELSESQTWKNLLHYETGDSATGLVSAIHNPKFFLAEEGATNPLKELEATVFAFLNSNADTDLHCRFPARLIWLSKKTPLLKNKSFDKSKCQDYLKWSQDDSIGSISVVYATGYLGNPASFYGHTLLKFNSKDQNKRTALQDNSLNFGAIVPDNENPVVYIFKGIFGGYEAGFSQIQYYFHNENYGEIELRDMWEYELNLPQEDVDFLVAHAWEVISREYTYYFLKENCAYRMGELFSILDGVNIIPDNSIYTYPQSLIQKLSDSSYKSQKLIKTVKQVPSRQTRLYSKYAQLSSQELEALESMIETKSFIQNDYFALLDLKQQHRVLDTLIDYYQLLRDERLGDDDANNHYYKKALSARFDIAPGTSDLANSFEISQRPEQSRNPSRTSIVTAYRNDKSALDNNFQTLEIRPAYYDSLDASGGHIAYSELTMGKFAFTKENNNYFLDYLDIVSIESVNAKATGLPGDDGFSWRMKFGAERFEPGCTSCRVFRVQGDAGYSHNLSSSAVVGGYIGGALHETFNNSENYFARATLFFQHNLSDNFNYKLNYSHRNDFQEYSEKILDFEMRYSLNKDWDLRGFYIKSQDEVYGLSLGYYW